MMPMTRDMVPTAFRIGVIGGGSWGTVLAEPAWPRKGFSVDLWAFEARGG
ncbi:MAG: hypothetical protein MZV70_35385 [Desulfobacterales bacterium]|nr:hypothetical protein [Desulfobacterales bacterium]